eukprot:TRINITY_DN23563_c0_g1_i1.p2 TRINITY_DN23563_c0_g1~~TRINITY_DN23563_c0_g1_i1.p2  ORF type:complete len:153 (+),score=50.44 TRINITY_DN23563_c0_g1_i1:56-514(+)
MPNCTTPSTQAQQFAEALLAHKAGLEKARGDIASEQRTYFELKDETDELQREVESNKAKLSGLRGAVERAMMTAENTRRVHAAMTAHSEEMASRTTALTGELASAEAATLRSLHDATAALKASNEAHLAHLLGNKDALVQLSLASVGAAQTP